jgi:amino acid adenylation domain-containing protein/non-ribosomal peptide synthase protein (TIGR01720 family)
MGKTTDVAKRRSRLSPAKLALLEKRLKGNLKAPSRSVVIPRRPDQRTYPLSFAQQRFWFLDQLEPGSPVYNRPMGLRLKGALDISALERAMNAILGRHDVLRANFSALKGQPIQSIAPTMSLSLDVVDLSDLNAADRENESLRLSVEEALRPFELAKDPLLRAMLFRLAMEDYILLVVMHHIVCDGWSAKVFTKELAVLYEAFCTETKSPLPELPIQYADHAYWQRQRLQGEVFDQQVSYWRDILADSPPLLDLPTDHPRQSYQTFCGANQTIMISSSLLKLLKALSRKENVTLFMTLLAAFKVLLYRYTGQMDIVVGSPIAGRSHIETEDLIGFFVNTLVLRTDLAGDPSFRLLLQRIREATLGAYENSDLPFEKLVEAVKPERQLSRYPFFQVLFNFENVPEDNISLPELSLSEFEVDSGMAAFDLSVEIREKNEELDCLVNYNTDLFENHTIRRMIKHYQILLEGVVANPDQSISLLPFLAAAERHQLLIDWNDTATDYPRDKCIHELIEEQVRRSPDNVAAVFEGQQLTYRQLNERANQLAHHLMASGLEPEAPVGIFLERSFEMLIGLLGILKAGGAYVPLDPTLPKGRLAFILEDTRTSFLITQQRLVINLPAREAKIICLDTDQKAIAREPKDNPIRVTQVENLAYIIYTSGSTGQPKGVLIPHQALVKHSNAIEKRFNIRPLDRVLQFAPFNFDVAAEELYPSLLRGARIVLREDDSKSSFNDFFQFLREEELSILNLPSSFWHELVSWLSQTQMDLPPALRLVIVGSDVTLSEQLLAWQQIAGDSVRLLNAYGPTEATITATLYDTAIEVRNRQAYSIPIGRPISNTLVYVLDAYQQPVPIGVAGELYIGGDGLARGYLNRPELTAEKFIPDPFSDKKGARLYKTGDLVRYLSNGNLEFLGRIDHQVKVRGYRIEPGEIEHVLGRHPAVEEVVVIAREDVPGDKRLVAYVVASRELTPTFSELRSFLKKKLPDYMIPSALVFLDLLPLTANGKVDRRALPTPDGVRPELDTAYQVPRAGVEQTLAQTWKQVLRIDKVGRQDNFFELGGDSILSIQIVAKAIQAGLRVTPKHLFQYQTIAELAEVVEAREPVTADQGVVTGPLPLSPIQHWFFDQQLEEPNHWNMVWVLEAKQPVDPEKMEQVVEALLRHHDALRLHFVPHGAGWKQELGEVNQPVPFTFIDLSHLPYAEAAALFSQEADRLHTTLNLSEGPLIQVALFKFSENQADRVLLVIHHLAVDGISWRILLDDLQTAYDQLCEKGSIQLPTKTTSYKEWTEGLVEYAQSNKLHEEVSYWGAVTNTACTHFPRDFVDGINTVASTRTVSVVLGQEDTRALLQEIPEVYHTQINDVLLAALVDVLAQWSQQKTICLNLEGHGREDVLEDIDLSRTVGWFTSIFPVVLKRDNPGHVGELLKSVKEQLRQIPHRGIGYGLLRYLSEDGKERDQLGDGLDPEVAFNYLGQFDQVIAVDRRWRWSEASGGVNRNPQDRQTDLISINAWIMNSVLQVQWSYSEAVHRRETIENLAQNYLDSLVTIIRHCQSPGAGGYTPSDFPLARVSQSDLNKTLTGTKSGEGKADLSDLYPLSPLQQGLWFHALANPGSGVYVEQSVFRIEGYTNRDVLHQAWEKVVEQHAILRTGIIWEGLEHPLQFVRSTMELPWTEVDWRESPDNEHQSRLLKFLDEDRLRGFDLTQAPLMRLTLIQIAETSTILVWSFHHLILDRWSDDLVQQEVWSAYQTLVQGQPLQFKALRPYREYIGWLQDQDLNRAEQYWRQLLSGFTAPTVLGVDQAPATRVGKQESLYDTEEVTLSEAATSALSRWTRQQQLTVNTVVQGAWALLLSRYSGSEDVVFGTTVAGRTAGLPGIESMIGLFINTLPVRVHVSPYQSLVPWLTELQGQQVNLREYEYTPLFEIQKWSEVPAGESLFNTLLVFENIPLESGGVELSPDGGGNPRAHAAGAVYVRHRTLYGRSDHAHGGAFSAGVDRND